MLVLLERSAPSGRERRQTMGQGLHVSSIGCIRGLFVPLIVAGALASGSLPALAQSTKTDTELNQAVARRAAPPQPLDVVKSSVTRVLAAVGAGQQTVQARRGAEELFDFHEMCRRMFVAH